MSWFVRCGKCTNQECKIEHKAEVIYCEDFEYNILKLLRETSG